MKIIGKWKSIYISNTKPESLFRTPVGIERSYTKSTMELRSDGTACVADGAIVKLFKKKLNQVWDGDDSDFAVFWDGALYMVGEYNNTRYPFESLITYSPDTQCCIIYRRNN